MVRYAVIGYGLAGATFHAPVISATPGAELAAVVVRSADAAARVRTTYPDVSIVGDVTGLSDLQIDAGVVATPNDTHADVATELLESGIAAVVDKPLAATAAEARALVDLAEVRGVALTCYQNRRWDGDFLTVRSLQDSGAIGRIHRFESRFERWRPTVKAGWKEVPGPGSGVLWDLGPHVVDQALTLLGPAESVSGSARIIRPGAVVPDDAFVRIVHAGGAESHLSVSHVAAAPGPRFRVLGTRGAYVKDGLDPQEDALRTGRVPGGADWGTEDPAAWGTIISGNPAQAEPVPTEPGDYPAFYRQLTAALSGNGPLPVDPRDSVAALEILEAIPVGAVVDRGTPGLPR